MRALVYHGAGKKDWESVADPEPVDPTDAVIRVDAVTICGTDLHILGGDVPEVPDGLVLGHEAVGTVVATGRSVGTVRPGDTVVVVGAGPIGLAAVTTARLFSPSAVIVVDPAEPRRRAAERLGAVAIDPAADDPVEVVRAKTGGLGADAALEAVGIPETFELCTALVRPGGRVANIGVHGRPATLHLETLWIRNVTITTGLVDTRTTPTLLRLLAAGQLDVSSLVTHRFRMADFLEAYDVFAEPGRTGALKVLVTAG